jgi:hypothetical protein
MTGRSFPDLAAGGSSGQEGLFNSRLSLNNGRINKARGEGDMAGNTVFSLVLKLFKWIGSVRENITTTLARQRDAKLKKYECTLTWKDGDRALMVNGDAKAENEDQARQLTNAEAVRKFPVLKPLGSHKEFTPPYMHDPKGALALWKIVEVPLTAEDRDLVTQGSFGPAAASIVGFS